MKLLRRRQLFRMTQHYAGASDIQLRPRLPAPAQARRPECKSGIGNRLSNGNGGIHMCRYEPDGPSVTCAVEPRSTTAGIDRHVSPRHWTPRKGPLYALSSAHRKSWRCVCACGYSAASLCLLLAAGVAEDSQLIQQLKALHDRFEIHSEIDQASHFVYLDFLELIHRGETLSIVPNNPLCSKYRSKACSTNASRSFCENSCEAS